MIIALLRNWSDAPRELLAKTESNPQSILKYLKLRRSRRIALMLVGSAVAMLGYLFPWYILLYDPPPGLVLHGIVQHSAHSWVNGFVLSTNADAVHDSLTAHGLTWVRIAIGLTLVSGVYLLIVNPQNHGSADARVKQATSALLTAAHIGFISAFLKDEWWANVHNGYQISISENVYLHNGADKTAAIVANSFAAYPLGGYFLLLLGVALAAIGLYSGTTKLTVEQLAARGTARKRASGTVSKLVGAAIPIALVGGVVFYTFF